MTDRYTEDCEVSMPIRKTRFHALQVTCFVLLTWILTYAQANPKGPSAASARPDYSGMYGFLTEGEFVQVTVEDHGHVTGFVSRYGDSEADHGVFLDHFFESGTLDGNQLTFATRTVHGVSFEFRGTVERGEGRSRSNEAYYVLKGTLIENSTDDAKKVSARSRQVALKSFPQDMSSPPADKK